MKIEVRFIIDDVECEAEVVDPHGNVQHLVAPTPEKLLAIVQDEVLATIEACDLAEQEDDHA